MRSNDGTRRAVERASLLHAARTGDVDWVNRFIQLRKGERWLGAAMEMAAEHGQLAVVLALITGAKVRDDNAEALRRASAGGHIEVVKVLIPVSNPKAMSSSSLRGAAMAEHLDVAELLLPVSNIEEAGAELAHHEMWGSLDWLARAMQKMGGHEAQVDEWVLAHGDRLPMMTRLRLAKARSAQAGAMGSPAVVVRPRIRS